jgi:SAM-dependent methyltransferase
MPESEPSSATSVFDKAAETYDENFTQTIIGHCLRERTRRRLQIHFQPGDTVLELGCGTGEDAVWLAQRDVHVVATDASHVMLEITQRKAVRAGVDQLVDVCQLDLNSLEKHSLQRQFDGVYSNFGPVNCTSDWIGLAAWLSDRVKPHRIVALGMMSPFCLWETIWHALHLDFKTATRRWSGLERAILPDGAEFDVFYPSVRTLSRAFGPRFIRTEVQGIGVFLPPTDIFSPVEARPRLLALLTALEKRFAHCWPLHYIADHYWIEFRRTL